MATALVIDDHRESTNMICNLLALLGVQARPAYGPREAMLILKEFLPDIIFLDIRMPGLDGFELISYVRRIPSLDKVPFVIITIDDQLQEFDADQQPEALFTIVKPATVETLEVALKKAGLFLDESNTNQ